MIAEDEGFQGTQLDIPVLQTPLCVHISLLSPDQIVHPIKEPGTTHVRQ